MTATTDRCRRRREGGGGAPAAGSRGIVNRRDYIRRALLVTVTVHLHSDLLNNAGIILHAKKKEALGRLARALTLPAERNFERILYVPRAQ